MKTQTKHTPGPWKIDTKGSKHFIDGNDGFTVIYLDRVTAIRGRDECELNARLIAAAPDLLEALRACLDPLQQAQNKYGDITAAAAFLAARAALAKAEGEQ